MVFSDTDTKSPGLAEMVDALHRNIASSLVAMRKQRKLSLTDLADLSGVHRSYLFTLEHPERRRLVTIDILGKIAAAFGVPAASILRGHVGDVPAVSAPAVPEPLRSYLAYHVRSLREHHVLSNGQFARRCRLAERFVRGLESHEAYSSGIQTLAQIGLAFDLEPAALVDKPPVLPPWTQVVEQLRQHVRQLAQASGELDQALRTGRLDEATIAAKVAALMAPLQAALLVTSQFRR